MSLFFITRIRFLEVHSAAPFVQRNCCAFKAFISIGNSVWVVELFSETTEKITEQIPLESKPTPKIPEAPPTLSLVAKLKLRDPKSTDPLSPENQKIQKKLDSDLPTTVMQAEEFDDLDDLVFKPSPKDKKRLTNFKIKAPE